MADTEELHNVISMMLGELNASHTGISGGGRPNAAVNNTRHPGFDMAPDKSGYYKVTHVYQNGPCDKDYVKLKAGDFILALNEQPLKSGDNYWKAFTLAPPGRFEFMVNSKPVADVPGRSKSRRSTSRSLATCNTKNGWPSVGPWSIASAAAKSAICTSGK